MTLAIRVRAQANSDIEIAADFIATDNREAAGRFISAVQGTLTQLASMPGMGKPYRSRRFPSEPLRVWSVTGFRWHLLFYCEREDAIEVVRLMHAARDWESLV